MKTISVGEFKKHFSHLPEQVEAGEEFAVTYGKKKQVVGYFLPEKRDQPKIKLGIAAGKAKFTFGTDFKITEKAFQRYELLPSPPPNSLSQIRAKTVRIQQNTPAIRPGCLREV